MARKHFSARALSLLTVTSPSSTFASVQAIRDTVTGLSALREDHLSRGFCLNPSQAAVAGPPVPGAAPHKFEDERVWLRVR